MEFIKEITVELSGEMLFEYITAVQSDVGRKIKVILLVNNQPYEIPAGATAVIRGKKPDGKAILNNCTIDESGAIIAELTKQTLAVCGNVRCQITLYSSKGGELTSVPFVVKVTAKSANDTEVKSTNEFNVIAEAEALAISAREIASEALENVSEVEARVEASTTAANGAANAANTAADNATSAKEATEKATEEAAAATKAANTATEAAQTATAEAEAATTAANEAAAAAENALAEIEGSTVTRYGVKFGGSANSGATVQRSYNAFGLVANVGTDTAAATNDFDNIYPWSGRKRACGYFDDKGNFVVNAYEGEPGYTTDGSNGEVWVETPLFYYLHTYNDDGSEEIVISAHPIGGYKPSPIHINADGSLRQKAYTAAYPMALVDDKPTSRSGVYTPLMSLNSGMSNARKLGDKYTTTTAAEQYVKCLLMWVEFATRDIQTKMKGCSSLLCSGNHKATVAESAANRIIISSSYAAAYVVGQGIAIGTSLGSTNVANNRTVTAIDAYDDSNSAITFDGDPVNIAVGNIVFAIAWKTGSCDNVLSSSGSPVSNTNGKYTCIYRGEETPFGNTCEWISDVLFKREGGGTTEDPYTYDIYFLPDATKYSSGSITDDYVKVNYQAPSDNGHVKTLGYDERFPFLRIPSAIGASTTTYYADCYSHPRRALCVASVGGYWNSSALCGPCFWDCSCAPSDTSDIRRARLSYRR